MQFRIADTFTDSLAKLTNQEQRAVKTTAFDLQLDPANPGMQFHRLDRARDRNFWSVRVNNDIRLIVHKTDDALLLCYVNHHDDAYAWAERRRIERHPRTGAAQLVEVRETVREIPVYQAPGEDDAVAPPAAAGQAAAKPLFTDVSDDDLLGYGVPEDWLDEVRRATEDTLFDLADHLPQEAAEALLDVAVGATPAIFERAAPEADPFAHPDASRRFRVLANVEELERALEYPWEKWTVFLHPAQRHYVEQDYSGPARISGSAGTGKTIVALHRAVHLARQDLEAKVLLTTFSRALANALEIKLGRLAGNEPKLVGRITVKPLEQVGLDAFAAKYGTPDLASDTLVGSLLDEATAEIAPGAFSDRFLRDEWREVVDAWQVRSWDEYRDVQRLGRKTRIGGKQRETLWAVFERTIGELAARNLVTTAEAFRRASEALEGGAERLFDYTVIDEAQDVSVPQLRFLAALGAGRPDALFFTGDLGQRIFQMPFSWKSLGVDVRGRSHTLRINYRTSHQIRSRADRLLPSTISDVDGVEDDRRGTVSVFNGQPPDIRTFQTPKDESEAVGDWISARLDDGIEAGQIAVIVRTVAEIARAEAAIKRAGVEFARLSHSSSTGDDQLSICTMHLAKGLEFRAVAAMACDDEIIPLHARLEAISDEADLEEVYDTERHLLYVTCTRARDYLLLTGVEPASEFLDDLVS